MVHDDAAVLCLDAQGEARGFLRLLSGGHGCVGLLLGRVLGLVLGRLLGRVCHHYEAVVGAAHPARGVGVGAGAGAGMGAVWC